MGHLATVCTIYLYWYIFLPQLQTTRQVHTKSMNVWKHTFSTTGHYRAVLKKDESWDRNMRAYVQQQQSIVPSS